MSSHLKCQNRRAYGEVTTLAHELGDHTVESRALEVKGLAGAAHALLAGAQRTEVLSRLGYDISTQLHHNTAQRSTARSHIKKNTRI